MKRPIDKWFSMQTDWFGRDGYSLGFLELSGRAMALYVTSIAYVSRWGTEECHDRIGYSMTPRPAQVVRELVEGGFWTKTDRKGWYRVEHEGVLWRRGTPLQRRAIPTKIRAYVFQRDGFACVECGSPEELTLDHVWPYSKGGTDEPGNLRTLCRSCNSAKGDRTDVS